MAGSGDAGHNRVPPWPPPPRPAVITPGTGFMARLGDHLRQFFRQKLESDPGWAHLAVRAAGRPPGQGQPPGGLLWPACASCGPQGQHHIFYGHEATQVCPLISLALVPVIVFRLLLPTCQVIFSDSSEPGEGEHKIMRFIRQQRTQVSTCLHRRPLP